MSPSESEMLGQTKALQSALFSKGLPASSGCARSVPLQSNAAVDTPHRQRGHLPIRPREDAHGMRFAEKRPESMRVNA